MVQNVRYLPREKTLVRVGKSDVPVMVGLIGLEPMTPALSRRCSNQLSYRPELVDS